MPVINRVAEFHAEMTQWRHRIHAHPETAFEEHKTAELVAIDGTTLRVRGLDCLDGTPLIDLKPEHGAK